MWERLAVSFHSYASRIGSKSSTRQRPCPVYQVSIHTLHELEARKFTTCACLRTLWFPFIRFTNWKQDWTGHGWRSWRGSFHSYASRIGSKDSGSDVIDVQDGSRFPFIRFTNWKQGTLARQPTIPCVVSIHTLHELEARKPVLIN